MVTTVGGKIKSSYTSSLKSNLQEVGTVRCGVESKVNGGCGRRVLGRFDDRPVEQCRIRVYRMKQSHQITMSGVDTVD